MNRNDAILEAVALERRFDVSAPWLNRVIERKPRQTLRAVDGVDFQIRRGQTLAIVGESGCGKSTIAKLVTGLYAPSGGTIRFHGDPDRMQMIFQDPYASLNPRWRVGRIIAEPLRTLRPETSDADVESRVRELLQTVGLSPSDASKYPHAFSGGQRQRISIARALAGDPEFLVCDEPTSALDVSVQAQVLNLMMELQAELGLSYLFISHDMAVVERVSHDVGVMYLGRIVEMGPRQAVFEDPRHPYTQALMKAVPIADPRNRKSERDLNFKPIPSPIHPVGYDAPPSAYEEVGPGHFVLTTDSGY